MDNKVSNEFDPFGILESIVVFACIKKKVEMIFYFGTFFPTLIVRLRK
jgi:hypothetical protein